MHFNVLHHFINFLQQIYRYIKVYTSINFLYIHKVIMILIKNPNLLIIKGFNPLKFDKKIFSSTFIAQYFSFLI